jgi:hypothetical protein
MVAKNDPHLLKLVNLKDFIKRLGKDYNSWEKS